MVYWPFVLLDLARVASMRHVYLTVALPLSQTCHQIRFHPTFQSPCLVTCPLLPKARRVGFRTCSPGQSLWPLMCWPSMALLRVDQQLAMMVSTRQTWQVRLVRLDAKLMRAKDTKKFSCEVEFALRQLSAFKECLKL